MFFGGAHLGFPTFLGLGGLVILWDAWRSRTSLAPPKPGPDSRIRAGFCRAGGALLPVPSRSGSARNTPRSSCGRACARPLSDYLFVFGLSLFVMVSLLAADLSAPVRRLFRRLRNPGVNPQTAWIYAALLATVLGVLRCGRAITRSWRWGCPIWPAILYVIFFKPEISPLRRVVWLLYSAGLAITLLVEVVVLKGRCRPFEHGLPLL